MLRIITAGESHGKCLVGIIEGCPSNFIINIDEINRDLARRQKGFGRGGRMKIETDSIEILTGVRGGKTLGSPIAFAIANKDYENWEEFMNPIAINEIEKRVTKARPGHADLAGAIKYDFDDVRNVLERSSARETAVRVAAGSILRQIMGNFNISVYSHVTSIGSVGIDEKINDVNIIQESDLSEVRCIVKEKESLMMEEIRQAKNEGDSLGGVFEVHITGVPVGLGSYVHWDRKLDAKLSYALMSIQGIKGVEIGWGFQNATLKGSRVHDEVFYTDEKYSRTTNNAGGIEGGMSNGENIVLRCAMKPIPTLYQPLKTVDIVTKEAASASIERSDTCAVPAASIVGEMVAITVIAEEFFKKFGGDHKKEIEKRWKDCILI